MFILKKFLQSKLGNLIIPNWKRQLASTLKHMDLDATTLNKNSVEECEGSFRRVDIFSKKGCDRK